MLVKKPLETLARYSASKTQLCGVPVLVVGGAVRDSLLGKAPHEYDFAFAADEETFLQRNPQARKVGKSVSVILLKGQEYMPITQGIEADLRRRDLTVNALAVDAGGTLFAHPDALDDLEAHVFRPASPESFRQDPVRVFRLARLCCEWPEFQLHPEAIAQMRDVAGQGLLKTVLPERVCKELMKALAAPKPSRWLETLREGNCLIPWFSELERALTIPAGPAPFHSESVYQHLLEIMDRMSGDPVGVWMALCHDIGKVVSPSEMLPHHYGHEHTGAGIAVELAERLDMPTHFRKAGELAAELHMKAGIYPTLRNGTRCDLLMAVHRTGLDTAFWKLVEADGNRPLMAEAMHDLDVILHISLPDRWKDKGMESGARLRELRCQALRKHKVKL